jgi:hypothetical protein
MQQIHETYETWLGTSVSIQLFVFVSIHVMLDFWHHQCVVWLVMPYNTFTTLGVLSGAMFMLTNLLNFASK